MSALIASAVLAGVVEPASAEPRERTQLDEVCLDSPQGPVAENGHARRRERQCIALGQFTSIAVVTH